MFYGFEVLQEITGYAVSQSLQVVNCNVSMMKAIPDDKLSQLGKIGMIRIVNYNAKSYEDN